MVDLDAIKAMWRGFDGHLYAAYDEDAEEWVVTSADDGSPYTGVLARMECDYAEQLGTLWGGAGPQVAALVAEVERLRAIVEGRTTAPTAAEMLVHWNAGGWWLVLDDCEHLHSLCVRERGDVFAGARRIMPTDRDGRPCAWPEVSRG